MKKFLIIAACAAMTLASCQKSENVVRKGSAVKFSVENVATYVVKAGAINGETPSQVGIFAADLDADNIAANVSGTTLTPTSAINWKPGQVDPTTFVAYYPYAASRTVTSAEFIPPYNQNSGEVDFSAYDNFVTAVKSADPETTVALSFSHPFAKLRLNITNNLGADVVDYIEIDGIKLASAIDIASGAVTMEETPSHEHQYPCPVTANSVYELVLVPQTASPTIIVHTLQGSSYTFVISAPYNFQAGKVGTAALTLSTSSSGTSGLSAASFSIDLTEAEWTDGTAATFGDPTELVSANYWYAIGTINGSSWDIDYPMTYNDNGEWKITIEYTAGQEFKFRKNKDWAEQFGNNGTATLPVETDYAPVPGGENFNLAESGTYDIYLTPATPKIWVVKQ